MGQSCIALYSQNNRTGISRMNSIIIICFRVFQYMHNQYIFFYSREGTLFVEIYFRNEIYSAENNRILYDTYKYKNKFKGR